MSAPRPLPSTAEPDPGWRTRAACQGKDTLFFDDGNEPLTARYTRITLAKAICQQCPVLTVCRESALQLGEPYGIWGGLSELERAKLLGVRTLRYAGVNRQRHLDTSTRTPPTTQPR